MNRDVTTLHPAPVSSPGCRPAGCAGLCTEAGMAAAHRSYARRLLARARQVVIDPDLAEEAVQEALLRAWQACATFDPAGGPVLNWLLTITRNAAVDSARARGRRPPPVAALPDHAAAEAPGMSDVDLLLLRAELRDALTGIGAEHRAVLVETFLRDRQYGEVAAEWGIPEGTVRTRVHYGLRRLRTLLGAEAAALPAGATGGVERRAIPSPCVSRPSVPAPYL